MGQDGTQFVVLNVQKKKHLKNSLVSLFRNHDPVTHNNPQTVFHFQLFSLYRTVPTNRITAQKEVCIYSCLRGYSSSEEEAINVYIRVLNFVHFP